MNRTTNMTVGNPTKLILSFAFPLIIANLGQQLYTIVDAIIVGKGVGVEALAAVGATDWAYWFALWTIGALTQGFAIPISQYFGEGNKKNLRKAISSSIILCASIGIALTVFCLVAARPILHLLQTPENIFDSALSYLLIMYSGILIVMVYNMASSILRALGDGKTPLVAIMIAGFTNIVLDSLFVLGFHWGIKGAAIATITAQLLAFLYCLQVLRKVEIIHLERPDWTPDSSIIKAECSLGIPLALQHILIVIGGMVLQFSINQHGFVFIAGFTATNKIYGLLESSALSLGYAISTYTAQNFGAGLYDRIRTGLKRTLQIAMVIAFTITVVMIAAGKQILMLFIDSSSADATGVLDTAYRYLFVMSVLLFILYLLHIFRNTLQGLGNASIPFWSGVLEFGARIIVATVFASAFGKSAIYFAEPGAWFAATVLLTIVCLQKVHQLPHNS